MRNSTVEEIDIYMTIIILEKNYKSKLDHYY